MSLPPIHHTQKHMKEQNVGFCWDCHFLTRQGDHAIHTVNVSVSQQETDYTNRNTLRRGFGKGCRETASTQEVGTTGLLPPPDLKSSHQNVEGESCAEDHFDRACYLGQGREPT